ncbi:MAG: hypothetical protein A2Y34_17410 [Spirochaetes bacterium GWC1_27_15]|nr:MAG: hypothetical protein A2Z98_05590 [Spirochaetes bacterium GWB1_27_13]OHD20668.1 MAG: hypothetical protein A2Y34_17410 [Spirochaetes bacterium GWC1_27_15]
MTKICNKYKREVELKRFLIILIVVFSFISVLLFSDSLWNDISANIYSQRVNYRVGDSIEIVIDEQSVIDYKTNSKSLKSFNINLQGGEMTGIFSFLPKGSIEENKNNQDKDNLKIQTTINARVTNVANGYITITGSKTIQINNKTSSFQIAGEANIADIVGKSILSKKLVNPTISITTLFDNKNIVLNQNDLQKVRVNPDSTTDLREETRITDQKKQQMLLDYFNKILNVIF